MNRDLGFGKNADFERQAGLPKVDEQALVDRAADRAGFSARETPTRLARIRTPSKELSDQAFVRAPLEVINRYKRFCNDTGYSYGEALDQLLRHSGY